MNRFIRILTGVLAGICFCAAVLTGITYYLACDAPIMERIMRETAPAEETLLPEAEYSGMSRMITGYLAGRTEGFQYIFSLNGTEYLAFQEHEQTHMADCRALIRLDRTVFLLSVGTLAVCLLTGLLRRTAEERGGFGKAFLTGAAAVMLLICAGAVWAVTDFERFFIFFHEIAFTNDLWLLDPRTDLLIRLMPETFFIRYGILGGFGTAVILTATVIPVTVRVFIKKNRASHGTRNGAAI